MDKIYITAYAVIVICLLRVVFSFLKTKDGNEAIDSRHRVSDMVVMAGLLALFVLTTTGIVLTA